MRKTITWLPTIILIALIVMGSVYGPTLMRIVGSTGLPADVIATDGYYGLVSMTPGHVSTENSSMAPLGIDGVFTGEWEDVSNYGVIIISLIADQSSATDGLEIQFSCDGTVAGIISTDNYTVPLNSGKTFSFQAAAKHMRVKYTNGGIAQGSFNMQTVLKPYYVKPSSHRISDAIISDDDAELVKAVITGVNPAGDFVNGQFTTAGNSKISIEEFETQVSVNSNTQLRTTSFHSDGTAGQLLTGIDYVSGKSGIDANTETLQTISYEHHGIHAGSHYEICDVSDLPINNVFDFQFTTPNTTEQTHLVYSVQVESETDIYIYESAVINVAGTTVTALNNNRNSSNTSSNTTASILNTSLALANADTDVSGAIEILHQTLGSGRTSQGFNDRSRELVLKQNTVYCMRAVATAAGYVNFCMQWYEHTPKN